jgi:hypothetical protein
MALRSMDQCNPKLSSGFAYIHDPELQGVQLPVMVRRLLSINCRFPLQLTSLLMFAWLMHGY